MEHQFVSAKRTGPFRLALNASPLPRPNWGLEDWQLQNSPPQHHHGAIPSSASGFADDPSNLEEAMWHRMTSQSTEEAHFAVGFFPKRPGEPDCVHYIRTGLCAFGMRCRYNHPPNRKLAAALARDKGEYPERLGHPECQYYLKTGTCKFGSTCKFHHPRERAGSAGRVSVNIIGFPLRLGEIDCAYYMRTGSCKFGATCKFNHPQPEAIRTPVAMSGSSMYASNGSPATPSPHPFPTGIPSWSITRAPYMPRSRFQSSSNFAPLIVPPQNLVSVPGWSTYQARMGPLASWDVQQPALGGASFMYGVSTPNEAPSAGAIHTAYNPYLPGSAATGLPSVMQSTAVSKDTAFPERPGQPDCQYYMKTGDCKFGMSCRYHHPRERISSLPNCKLSQIGLPLRQGVPQCAFYMQYGMCKFGPTCKFDHPISSLTDSLSASSLKDMPVAPYSVGLSVATRMPLFSEPVILGPKMIFKGVENAENKQQGYEDSYLGSSSPDETAVSSNARLGTAGSDRSGSADSVELREGDPNQAVLNASS